MAFLSNRFYKKGKNRTNEHRASEAALNDFWNLETEPHGSRDVFANRALKVLSIVNRKISFCRHAPGSAHDEGLPRMSISPAAFFKISQLPQAMSIVE